MTGLVTAPMNTLMRHYATSPLCENRPSPLFSKASEISVQFPINAWFPCRLRYNVRPGNPLRKRTREFYLMRVSEL